MSHISKDSIYIQCCQKA